MKRAGILVSLCCAFALCLAFAGCGGSADNGQEEAAKAAFAGTWDLVGMVQDGEETSSEDIEMLSALGLDVYLDLNEDGTSELVLFGESMEGTWTAESETAGTLTLQDQNVSMTIDGDNMSMTEGSSSLTFQKGAAHDTASSDAAATTDDADDAGEADDSSDEEGEASAEQD